MDNNVEVSNNNRKTLIIIIIILSVIVVGLGCYIFLNLNNNEKQTPINNETTKPTQTEVTPTEEDEDEEEVVVDVKENEIFDIESKKIKLNGKDVTVSLKYYILKEYDEELEKSFYNLYYDIYLNDKAVKNADKNYVYYDECDYVDDDTEDCNITKERLSSYTNNLIELGKVTDNNKKEYVTVRLDGGGPQDSEKLYVIDDSSNALVYMYIDLNLGYGKITGDAKKEFVYADKGEDYSYFHYYVLKSDKINYLEAKYRESDDDTSESDQYSGNEFYVHTLTIENGKVVDKKTGDVLIASGEASGGSSNFITIKTY